MRPRIEHQLGLRQSLMQTRRLAHTARAHLLTTIRITTTIDPHPPAALDRSRPGAPARTPQDARGCGLSDDLAAEGGRGRLRTRHAATGRLWAWAGRCERPTNAHGVAVRSVPHSCSTRSGRRASRFAARNSGTRGAFAHDWPLKLPVPGCASGRAVASAYGIARPRHRTGAGHFSGQQWTGRAHRGVS